MQERSLRAVTATQAAVLLPEIEGAAATCRRVTSLRFERQERAAPRASGGAELDDYVANAASGDVRAFEQLYNTHLPKVHSLVRRMSGGRDADELTQDVFVRVWQKLGSFRGESAFSTWLHRLAVNVVIERFRQETTRRQRMHDGEEIFETLPAPRRSDDAGMDFEAAIASLPDGARRVFVLHDVEGYKHHEIGALLEISTGTSKAQLHRARMMLRRYLK
jgi:RNA polymerase sigma-70 factor, ECF subfamily